MRTILCKKLPRVLLLDDTSSHRAQITRHLVDFSFEVEEVSDASQLTRALQRASFDLLILSLVSAAEDSISIVKRLRAQEELVPIIVLLDSGDTIGRIMCLELGADDCLQRPFEPRELRARISMILRRANSLEKTGLSRSSEEVTLGTASIDLAARKVQKNGQTYDLSTREFNLLQTFLSFPNRPMNRERLMDLAHGSETASRSRSIDVQILRLRKIVEPDAHKPRYIQTVWGAGYMYVPDGGAQG